MKFWNVYDNILDPSLMQPHIILEKQLKKVNRLVTFKYTMTDKDFEKIQLAKETQPSAEDPLPKLYKSKLPISSAKNTSQPFAKN